MSGVIGVDNFKFVAMTLSANRCNKEMSSFADISKTGLFIPRVKIKSQIESWPPTHTSIDLISEDGGAIAICLLLNVVNSTADCFS